MKNFYFIVLFWLITLFCNLSILKAQPYYYSVFAGDTIILYVDGVNGGANIQWQKTMDTTSTWNNISEATYNNYQYIIPEVPADIYYIRAEITDNIKCDNPYYGSIIKLRKVNSYSDILIGDFYAGGFVFYNDGTHGLVAAPSDQSTGAQWGCSVISIPGALGTVIGTGAANTEAIVASCAETNRAARICNDLVLNGYSDWFLPSIDELNAMYDNLHQNGVGGFSSNNYWSSSEFESDPSNAFFFYFAHGGPGYFSKTSTYRVRAVRRAFAEPILTVQQRLDLGHTPLQIYNDELVLDSLYGKTYQGGLIFYLNTTTGEGLVSAPSDQSTGAQWGCYGTSIPGASETAIGTGAANTAAIVAGCAETNRAAQICNEHDDGTYGDWFLPSIDELNAMYNNLHQKGFGGFSSVNYWSSTEYNAAGAFFFTFYVGSNADYGSKANTFSVRAVRAFAEPILTVQQRLDIGHTPLQIYNDELVLDSLYGKTYQGGLIFYLNTTTGEGLVSAPSDQSTGAEWGCQGTSTGASGQTIGTGATNTAAIVASCAETNRAARICNNLVLNGYSDWFLPSKDELYAMYNNLYENGFGGFSSAFYWSSTEGDAAGAFGVYFYDGYTYNINKTFTYSVRAVRAF